MIPHLKHKFTVQIKSLACAGASFSAHKICKLKGLACVIAGLQVSTAKKLSGKTAGRKYPAICNCKKMD